MTMSRYEHDVLGTPHEPAPPAGTLDTLDELDALLRKIKNINTAAPWTDRQLAITQGCEQARALVAKLKGGA
jgi:hypothetical protein